jgi:hypothetical protein
VLAPAASEAACGHEVWLRDPVVAGGMKLVLVESTASEPVPGQWIIEACFSVANEGGAAETVTVNMIATDNSPSGLDFDIVGSRTRAITAPGLADAVICSVPSPTIGHIENVAGISPGNLTDLCCFDFEAISPGGCSELPGTLNGTVQDTLWVEMSTSAGSVFDEPAKLGPSGDPDISGPGCGLVGLELLLPAVVVRRVLRRRAARRREARR